jgi:hypothetical protein
MSVSGAPGWRWQTITFSLWQGYAPQIPKETGVSVGCAVLGRFVGWRVGNSVAGNIDPLITDIELGWAVVGTAVTGEIDGFPVGGSVGRSVGALVAILTGDHVGYVVAGGIVGWSEGTWVSCVDGRKVGVIVSHFVGDVVGKSLLGNRVGSTVVGPWVDCNVGRADGKEVGLDVGKAQ